jgi:pimeloyl-ACP methyl ester carboxylesterase
MGTVSALIAVTACPYKHGEQPPAKISVDSLSNGTVYAVTQQDTAYTFDSARYAVFIPANVPLRGVFVHQHGCTMEGHGMASAYDIQYQAFARKWGLAVVAPDLYSAKNNCRDWWDAESGSIKSLIKALTEIGRHTGHPELDGLPWLLWGHSGGGYWALSALKAVPERIIAVFGYSPGTDPQWNYPKEALKVPVFIRHAGAVGDQCCWQTALHEFHKLRSDGGLAAIAYTAGQNHNYSFVRYMAVPFFEAVMKQRLPDSPAKNYRALRNMDATKAWLGDTLRYDIFPTAEYPGDRLSASWLPDSATAMKWKEYILTGTVVDHTPPPPPYNLKIRKLDNTCAELTWQAAADVESGISHFILYKNSQPVGRFPASDYYQRFDTNGDDAIPCYLPELRRKIEPPENAQTTFAVSAVNHFGLESTRTEAK